MLYFYFLFPAFSVDYMFFFCSFYCKTHHHCVLKTASMHVRLLQLIDIHLCTDFVLPRTHVIQHFTWLQKGNKEMTHLWKLKDKDTSANILACKIFLPLFTLNISLVYPQAYSLCKTDRERISLLSDLLIRRGEGVTSTTRRVGPELSKRLFLMMNSCDGEQTLDSTVWNVPENSIIGNLVAPKLCSVAVSVHNSKFGTLLSFFKNVYMY